MQRHCAPVIVAVSSVAVLGGNVQTDAHSLDEDGVPPQRQSVFFSIPVGLEHQFRSDISGGGSFDVSHVGVGLGVKAILPHDMDVSFRFNYSLDDYSFRGTGNFGDGWDDVHTFNFGAIFSAQLSPDWRVFAGPAFQFARESGASWSDSFIGGGFAGATYNISPDLTIGGGFGVVSQIEDSARFFPILILDWRIMDGLKLSNTTAASAGGSTGLELVYEVGGGWEAAIGAASRFRRFRLDEDGPVPDGVGEERSIPIWGRVSYKVSNQFSINGFVGVSAGGRLRLEDERGDRIASRSYDAAPFLGISGELRF